MEQLQQECFTEPFSSHPFLKFSQQSRVEISFLKTGKFELDFPGAEW